MSEFWDGSPASGHWAWPTGKKAAKQIRQMNMSRPLPRQAAWQPWCRQPMSDCQTWEKKKRWAWAWAWGGGGARMREEEKEAGTGGLRSWGMRPFRLTRTGPAHSTRTTGGQVKYFRPTLSLCVWRDSATRFFIPAQYSMIILSQRDSTLKCKNIRNVIDTAESSSTVSLVLGSKKFEFW